LKNVVFARIDPAVGTQKVGKTLRTTALLIFDTPRGGTLFMECQQSGCQPANTRVSCPRPQRKSMKNLLRYHEFFSCIDIFLS
jgi:hypothetical protein